MLKGFLIILTDDWDRRLCKAYLEEYMHPDQLDGELMLAPGFPTPPNMDYHVKSLKYEQNLNTLTCPTQNQFIIL